jgi:hypothetical protein
VAPQHTNGDDEKAAREERKRKARIPADSANGITRYNIRALDRPIGELVIAGDDGRDKIVRIHRLSFDAKQEIAIRTREAQEEVGDADGAQQRLVESFRTAIKHCVRGASASELGLLNEDQIGRILLIAAGQETDTPVVGDAKEAEHHARTRSRKGRR